MSYPVRYGVDWLRFSKPNHSGSFHDLIEEVQSLFTSTGEVRPCSHGYRAVEISAYGTLGVRSSNLGGHDLLVDLPAQALEYARERLFISDQQICRFFLDRGFKAKRCDVAADSEDTTVNPAVVFKHLETAHVCCEAKNKTPVLGKSPIGEKHKMDGKGWTVYVGSRSSTRFMRVYDKIEEKRTKTGEILTDKATGREIEHCTRFELENKGEAAQKAVELIADQSRDAIPKLLLGWIDFKDPKSRRAFKYHRPSVDWWQRIVGKDGVKLGLRRGAATPEKSIRWLKEQVARTIALTQEYGVWNEIQEVAGKASISRALHKQWAEWQEHRAEKHLEDVQESDYVRLRKLCIGIGENIEFAQKRAQEILAGAWK